jgi:hypothetical protein
MDGKDDGLVKLEGGVVLAKFMGTLTQREHDVFNGLSDEDRGLIVDMVHKDREFARSFLDNFVVMSDSSHRNEAMEAAKKTAALITANIHPMQQALPQVIAPYPHDITRKSMFFIESSTGERKIATRDMLNGMMIGTGSWGHLKLTGPRLYIRDEKILLTIFSAVSVNIQKNKQNPYIVCGSFRELLLDAGLGTGGHYYKQVRDSLEHMGRVTFSLTGHLAGSKKKNRHLDPLRQYHLVKTNIDTVGEDETATYTLYVDPQFFETFIQEFHLYQKIDVRLYCSLPPVAAAIYRFFNSHQYTNGRKAFGLLLVTKVINLLVDEDWPEGADRDAWPDSKIKSNRKTTVNKALKTLVVRKAFGGAFIKTGIRGEDDTVVVLEKPQKQLPVFEPTKIVTLPGS